MQIAVFQLKPAVFLYILYFFALYAKFRNGSAVPQFFASPPVAWHCGFFLCIVKKKRAFKYVKRSAFQIRFGIKKAAFPPLGALAVTRNALILLFIYLFNFNIRKPLSFRDSPGLSRFIPVYPVQYPFMTCILPLYSTARARLGSESRPRMRDFGENKNSRANGCFFLTSAFPSRRTRGRWRARRFQSPDYRRPR